MILKLADKVPQYFGGQNLNSISALMIKCAPAIFVVLWATGFVGARYGTIDAEPLIFLFVRFALTIAILVPGILLILRPVSLPIDEFLHSMVIGIFMQGIYLGGVFYAVSKGMPAGISALIAALQPFFTVIFAYLLLNERISVLRLLFFVCALGGIFLVLFPSFSFGSAIEGVTTVTLVSVLLSPIAISFGAVYQKRVVQNLNLWIATAAQFLGGAVIVGLVSLAIETPQIEFTANTVFSLLWLVFVLSIGAIGLLMFLIRKASSSLVASLFFLVPVVAMFMTWILFDEQLNAVQILGSVVVVVSVALASRVQLKT